MIIAGLVRVFYSLYRFGKLLSGKAWGERHDEGDMAGTDSTPCKVLESAEGMILELWAARIWGICWPLFRVESDPGIVIPTWGRARS